MKALILIALLASFPSAATAETEVINKSWIRVEPGEMYCTQIDPFTVDAYQNYFDYSRRRLLARYTSSWSKKTGQLTNVGDLIDGCEYDSRRNVTIFVNQRSGDRMVDDGNFEILPDTGYWKRVGTE